VEESLVLQELENLAGDLEVEVRYDAIERHGGLCRFGGRVCLILNRTLSVPERICLIARALSRFPLDGVYIRPRVRELLEEQRATPLRVERAEAR
jgi:hypothetical protein